MIIDFLIILALAVGAYMGARRGALLITFEILSLVIATSGALVAYSALGSLLAPLTSQSRSSNAVIAFAIIWMAVEILSALAIRYAVLPKLSRHHAPTKVSRAGGAVMNLAKYAAYITVALAVFASLPMSAVTKREVVGPAIPHLLLASSGMSKVLAGSNLGRDVSSVLDFYTISADPESTERISLGYTAKDVSVDPQAEDQMLTLINQARTQRHLKALIINTKAQEVARAHSRDMFAKGYFSHLTPSGLTPFQRMTAAGISYGAAGENLALAPNVHLAFQGLMASPPHRANILNPHFRTVGIGIMNGGPYGLMVTQDFTD